LTVDKKTAGKEMVKAPPDHLEGAFLFYISADLQKNKILKPELSNSS